VVVAVNDDVHVHDNDNINVYGQSDLGSSYLRAAAA
jgi:hypothetical protein